MKQYFISGFASSAIALTRRCNDGRHLAASSRKQTASPSMRKRFTQLKPISSGMPVRSVLEKMPTLTTRKLSSLFPCQVTASGSLQHCILQAPLVGVRSQSVHVPRKQNDQRWLRHDA
jgi:hypothetical protein